MAEMCVTFLKDQPQRGRPSNKCLKQLKCDLMCARSHSDSFTVFFFFKLHFSFHTLEGNCIIPMLMRDMSGLFFFALSAVKHFPDFSKPFSFFFKGVRFRPFFFFYPAWKKTTINGTVLISHSTFFLSFTNIFH